MKPVRWNIKPFTQVSTLELSKIYEARIAVFVVEQNCPYQDVDGYDLPALHLWAEDGGEIIAYCRIFGPGIKYHECSLGRVLTHQNYRKLKIGKMMMKLALETVSTRFKTRAVRISAQDYLLSFYEEFGFEITGKHYLEDNIPHSEMLRR